MKSIKVDLGNKGYFIHVGCGAREVFPRIIEDLSFEGPIVVITDRNVWDAVSDKLDSVFKSIKNEFIFIFVPSGEKAKSINVFEDVIQKISEETQGYKPLIVAFGGGVVGDLSGFLAATYRRGVNLIQFPTTLLAQVDSSIGGKAAIDIPKAKNMVGAFYQPKAVVTDTELLLTLPREQVINGMAEVIKYAVISDKDFFDFLEQNMEELLALDQKVLVKAIVKCVEEKAEVVALDEFDTKDIRVKLNFGHTFGHAIEVASGYSGYEHGQAVAIGMVMAARLAQNLKKLSKQEVERLTDLIRRASLSTKAIGVRSRDILESLMYDKKFIGGKNRFILPVKIGDVRVFEDIPIDEIKKIVIQDEK